MVLLKFSKRESVRIVAFILVNSFVFFDFTCVGAAELIKAEQSDCLSPSLQINTKLFPEYFSSDNSNLFMDDLNSTGMLDFDNAEKNTKPRKPSLLKTKIFGLWKKITRDESKMNVSSAQMKKIAKTVKTIKGYKFFESELHATRNIEPRPWHNPNKVVFPFDSEGFNFSKLYENFNPAHLIDKLKLNKNIWYLGVNNTPMVKNQMLVVPQEARAQVIKAQDLADIYTLLETLDDPNATLLHNSLLAGAGFNSMHMHLSFYDFPIFKSGFMMYPGTAEFPTQVFTDKDCLIKAAKYADSLYAANQPFNLIMRLGKVIIIPRPNELDFPFSAQDLAGNVFYGKDRTFDQVIKLLDIIQNKYADLIKSSYLDQFIESNGQLVAGLIRSGDTVKTDINNPIQVESGKYGVGAVLSDLASQDKQGVLYIIKGMAEVKIKDEQGNVVKTIKLAEGDIINSFTASDIVFTQDSKVHVFRQTAVSQIKVDHKQILNNEEKLDSGVVVKNDGIIVADIYRDQAGNLIATVNRADMASPTRMSMITPQSAAIGIGVKIADGKEDGHRHELAGKSKMEIALCRAGSLTAYVGNKQGEDINKVEVKDNDLLILYPDSAHGFEFNKAKMAIVIQDPGRGMDKQAVQLGPVTKDHSMRSVSIDSLKAALVPFLNAQDSTFNDLNADVLLLCSNDDIRTFKETLRLYAAKKIKNILISGGVGRLTFPLLQAAQKAGFEIKINKPNEPAVTIKPNDDLMAFNFNGQIVNLAVLSKQSYRDAYRKIVDPSESEIIYQIMQVMAKDMQISLNADDVYIENESSHTWENFKRAIPYLKQIKHKLGKENISVVYIQTPHQQFRTKASFNDFKKDWERVGVEGISYTIDWDAKALSQDEFTEKVAGELWRVIVYTAKKNLTPLYRGSEGLEAIPPEYWKMLLSLISNYSDQTKLKDILYDLVAAYYPKEAELRKALGDLSSKGYMDKIISWVYAYDFNQVISDIANREEIPMDTNPKVALFIGGSHINKGYYYKLFNDIIRQELGVNIVYLPFSIDKEKANFAKNREEFIKNEIKNNPRIAGAVITRPWKEDFLDILDVDQTKGCGAVNYIVVDSTNGEKKGSAIDGKAWVDGLNKDLGDDYKFEGKKIVIIGTGGAAKEIAVELKGKGLGKITFAYMDEAQKTTLTAILKGNVGYAYEFVQADIPGEPSAKLQQAIKNADIVINATGIGRKDTFGISPLIDHQGLKGKIVSDLISDTFTQILSEAEQNQAAHVFYGRSMFISGMVQFMRGWIAQIPGANNPEELELYNRIDKWLKSYEEKAAKIKSAAAIDALKNLKPMPADNFKITDKTVEVLKADLILNSELALIGQAI